MMELASKKNVKIISLVVAAVFIIGMVALGLNQMGMGMGGGSSALESAIGMVDYQELVRNAPGMADVSAGVRTEIEAVQKEFKEKSEKMNDGEKAALMAQLRERVAAKEAELIKPVRKKVDDAINTVVGKKGLAVVVDKHAVVYGGLDVTSDVNNELRKK